MVRGQSSEDKYLPHYTHHLEWRPAPPWPAPLTAQAAGPQALLQGALLLLITATQAGRVLWGAEWRCREAAGGGGGCPAVTGWPARVPIPFGSPSCCSSLDKDSPSTPCLAALKRIKLSTATVAFTSPDSGGTHGWGRGCHCGPSHLSHKYCYCWQKTRGGRTVYVLLPLRFLCCGRWGRVGCWEEGPLCQAGYRNCPRVCALSGLLTKPGIGGELQDLLVLWGEVAVGGVRPLLASCPLPPKPGSCA